MMVRLEEKQLNNIGFTWLFIGHTKTKTISQSDDRASNVGEQIGYNKNCTR